MRRPPVVNSDCDSSDGSTKESRFAKVKRIISGTLLLGSRSSQTSGQKDSKMARKRDHSQDEEEYEDHDKCNMKVEKEIKESRLFIERKLTRSNSEERPINVINKDLNAVKADNIRRVSSHEDFKKKNNNNNVGALKVSESGKEPLHEINVNKSGKFSSFINDDNTPIILRHYSPNKTNISPNRDPKAHFFEDSDTAAAEKRRQCERFSRPRGRAKLSSTPISTSKAKKRKTSKYNHHITDIKSADAPEDEKTIPIDLKTLHEQIDSSEPVPISFSSYSNMYSKYSIIEAEEPAVTKDDNEIHSIIPANICPLLSSPRNSLILTRKVYLEPLISTKTQLPTVPVTKTHHRNPIESRIRHISKQINSIKKKLKKAEESVPIISEDGGRYSDKKIRTLHMELSKLKKELKGLKTGFEKYQEPGFAIMTAKIQDGAASVLTNESDDEQLQNNLTGAVEDGLNDKKRAELVNETMMEIQRKLSEKRQHANRMEEINEMTEEQLIDEKTAVQKALLHLESIHGRPITKEDRDIVRPLYDRYRILKRNVARTANAKLNNSVELGTILEHETMHFVSSSTTSTTDTTTQENENKLSSSPSSDVNASTITTLSGNSYTEESNGSDTDTSSSINENLHSLTYEELLEHLKQTLEEKKKIRRTLKEYEHDFEQRMGRKLQKDDRINSALTPSIENTYFMYKQVKGKLKLIEILLEKKRPQRN